VKFNVEREQGRRRGLADVLVVLSFNGGDDGQSKRAPQIIDVPMEELSLSLCCPVVFRALRRQAVGKQWMTS